MRRSLPISTLALVSILSYPYQVSAQTRAVGLHYPDFMALRIMVLPTGLPNLPPGPEHDELATLWAQISRGARDLLLKERDLALVVVYPNGNWLYRTTGVHTLRSLYGEGDLKHPEDLAVLLTFLNRYWFLQMRNFYEQTLVTANTSYAPAVFGEHLATVNNAIGVSNASKDWFRSIVGAEILHMDNTTRSSLLLNPKYGRAFGDAIALAEVTRNAQLQSVGKAIAEGPKRTIEVKNTFCSFLEKDAIRDTKYNVRFVNGKKLIEASSMGSVCWFAAKEDGTGITVSFSSEDVPALLEAGKGMVFLSGHGSSTVYGVEIVHGTP